MPFKSKIIDTCHHAQLLIHGLSGPTSGSHACIASVLLTEMLPESPKNFFFICFEIFIKVFSRGRAQGSARLDSLRKMKTSEKISLTSAARTVWLMSKEKLISLNVETIYWVGGWNCGLATFVNLPKAFLQNTKICCCCVELGFTFQSTHLLWHIANVLPLVPKSYIYSVAMRWLSLQGRSKWLGLEI